MVVGNESLGNRNKDVQVFVDGWRRAVDFINEDPEAAYAIMAKGLKIPEKDLTEMVKGLRYADGKVNDRWLGEDDAKAAIELFDQAVSLWKDAGIIETTP